MQPAAAAGIRTVVLIDTSASMQRAEMWEAALAEARTVIRETGAHDQLAVYRFDLRCERVFTFDEWMAMDSSLRADALNTRLDNLQPGWAATRLDLALIRAADELDALSAGDGKGDLTADKRIVLISDVAAGSELSGLQSWDWPRDVRLDPRPVTSATTTNAGIRIVGDEADSGLLRVRVYNATDSVHDSFQLAWHDTLGAAVSPPVTVYVAPGHSRYVALPDRPGSAQSERLVLSGDDHAFDNTAFVTESGPEDVVVHYYGDERVDDPRELRFYLERAFPDTPRRRVTVVAPQYAVAENILLTKKVRLVVASSDIPADRAPALQAWLRKGGTLLFVACSEGRLDSLASIIQVEHLEVSDAAVTDYAMVTDVDFAHPIFAVFAESHFSDFSRIRVWRHRSIDLAGFGEHQVLARFDDGDPAIIEVPVAMGHVLLFAVGWQPGESQLALSSRFVPLLNSILDIGTGRPDSTAGYVVGDPIPIAKWQGENGGPATLVDPHGKQIQLASTDADFTGTVLPGTWTLISADGASRFAVNVDPDESRTDRLPIETLESLGIRLSDAPQQPVSAGARPTERQLRSAELENRQRYWQWLIVAAIFVLAVESLLAGRLSHRQPAQATAPRGRLATTRPI